MSNAVHQEEKPELDHPHRKDRAFGLSPKSYGKGNHEEGVNGHGDDEHPVPIRVEVVEHERDGEVGGQDSPTVLDSEVHQCEVLSKGQEREGGQDPDPEFWSNQVGQREGQKEGPEVRQVDADGRRQPDSGSQERKEGEPKKKANQNDL